MQSGILGLQKSTVEKGRERGQLVGGEEVEIRDCPHEKELGAGGNAQADARSLIKQCGQRSKGTGGIGASEPHTWKWLSEWARSDGTQVEPKECAEQKLSWSPEGNNPTNNETIVC